MEDYMIKIKGPAFKENFTIIYKGPSSQEQKQGNPKTESIEEIQTSKEELIRQLGFFKKQQYEIEKMSEMFIHDIYPIQIFRDFIQTLSTNEISINESNYQYLYDLSTKYEFQSLLDELNKYSENRPDINRIIDTYNNENIKYEINEKKEEILSEHLDICLKNKNMINFPIQMIIRIINHPKRKLKDHSLLIQFINKLIETRSKEELTNEYIEILFGSFDYLEMSNEELYDLFHNEKFQQISNSSHKEKRIEIILDERKQLLSRIDKLEMRVESLEKQTENDRKTMNIQNEEKAHKYEEMFAIQKSQQENLRQLDAKIKEQANQIQKYEELIAKFQKTIESQEIQITQQKGQIQKIEQKQK